MAPSNEDTSLPTSVLMFLSFRYAEMKVMDAIGEAGHDDLTLAQARVCARIAPRGSRLTDLAEQAQITKQSAGALVDQLERNGYVARIVDPSDARARLITFTEKGQSLVARARGAEQRVEGEFEQLLGASRMRELRESLSDLRKLVDPWR